MLKIKFISCNDDPWLRQFPDRGGLFDGVQFIFDLNAQDYDFLVVQDTLPTRDAFLTRAPREQRILVASEPATVKRHGPARYLEQFGSILTTDAETPHPNAILSQVGLPWHVGSWEDGGRRKDHAFDFRFFENFYPVKTKLASVVSSDKVFTQDHRARLEFFHKLKLYFGDNIDYFGRGINSFVDKMDVLAPYRYHIAIENCSTKYYWTEKLSDPYLALAYPIYHGCTNISEYFPDDALVRIDIHDPEAAIGTIRNVIESDLAERSQAVLLEARRKVLYEHNLFALLAALVKSISAQRATVSLERVQKLYNEEAYAPLAARTRRKALSIIEQRPALYRLLRRARRLIAPPNQNIG